MIIQLLKEKYDTPELQVEEIQIERGFAQSGNESLHENDPLEWD